MQKAPKIVSISFLIAFILTGTLFTQDLEQNNIDTLASRLQDIANHCEGKSIRELNCAIFAEIDAAADKGMTTSEGLIALHKKNKYGLGCIDIAKKHFRNTGCDNCNSLAKNLIGRGEWWKNLEKNQEGNKLIHTFMLQEDRMEELHNNLMSISSNCCGKEPRSSITFFFWLASRPHYSNLTVSDWLDVFSMKNSQGKNCIDIAQEVAETGDCQGCEILSEELCQRYNECLHLERQGYGDNIPIFYELKNNTTFPIPTRIIP